MISVHWALALLIAANVFVVGAIAGQWDTHRLVRRRLSGRSGGRR